MQIHKTLHRKYLSLPPHQKRVTHLLIGFAGLLIFLLLLEIVHICTSNHIKPSIPILLRQGENIRVPLDSPLRKKLSIQEVKPSNRPHTLSFPGVVESDPSKTVNVLPPVTGRLLSIHVKLGDQVKKNQTLATMSSPDLAQARTDFDNAKSMLNLTSTGLARAKDVYRVGGNSLKDVQLAQNDQNHAFSEVERTKAKLAIIGKSTFDQLTIKAPISGRVTAINYGVGSYINDLTASILTISNINTIWVTAYVPENLSGTVSANQEVTIRLPAYPQQTLHAKITFVNAFLEPDTRRNKTRIAFPNPNGKLQPNMYANVHVSLPEPNVIMIPISAILMNNDTTSVYVEIKPWVFQRQTVQLGLEDEEHVRILSGLKSGDRIVTSGGIFIND